MWPFKKKRKNVEEDIVDALFRLGATSKVYCNKEGTGAPPDDGKTYGQYTLTVDRIILKFFIGYGSDHLWQLKAIKATTGEEYHKEEVESALDIYWDMQPKEEVVEYREYRVAGSIEPIVLEVPLGNLCTPEDHPSCGFDFTGGGSFSAQAEEMKMLREEKKCLDCGAQVFSPYNDHCEDCVRKP